ncbi:glycosyltransferase [Auraticoccus sp. F435]|uniref:Glycosyltransferase n=1 Tax=Auraticoccus cholistanensis TaxID=2656650 RepID=A0A6A9V202_9ACTN|nr:glycosyltransferase [Auraticoccus cholistanensis]MVA77613.1 glycosyltransferase [Auraticoccus cholistanensis]
MPAQDRLGLRIAAIVPCHDEEITVAKVVRDLRAAVPGMVVYVYDNNSTDRTAERALEAGAVVRRESLPGKGNVIRRAFADIDADVYVTIDGDDTYEAGDLPAMIDKLLDGPYDHVLGVRRDTRQTSSYRPGHETGNKIFNRLTSALFRAPVSDMLSGYRVFSRRFVKSFPAISRRFETETELTVHMMSLRLPCAEHPVGFRERPEGSESKLSTVGDGLRILGLLAQLVRHERPTLFYGVLSLGLAALSLLLGVPVVAEYAETGLVPRLPTAVLAAALMGLAFLMGSVGLILDGLLRARRESARLTYLRLAPTLEHRSADELHPDPVAGRAPLTRTA